MKLLLVEDSPSAVTVIIKMLDKVPDTEFNLKHVSSLADCKNALKTGEYDLLLLDLGLPDSLGLNTLNAVREEYAEIPIIIISSTSDDTVAIEALRYGAQDYLTKGFFEAHALNRSIRYSIERKKNELELIKYRARLEELIQDRTAELIRANNTLRQEIVERKSAEDALRKSERKYRQLIEDSPIGIFKATLDGTITDANTAFAHMLGFDNSEEVLSKEVNMKSDVFRDENACDEIIGNMRSNIDVGRYEVNMYRRDDSKIFVAMNCKLISSKSKEPEYVLGFVEDITTYRDATENLKQKDSFLTAIIDNFPFDFWAYFTDSDFVIQNKNSIENWGDCSKNVPLQERVDPLTYTVFEEFMQSALHGDSFHGERRLLLPNGTERDYLVISAPIKDEEEIQGALAFTVDITERLQADETIRESEEKFRSIIEQSLDGILITLENGIITGWNSGMERITGYNRSEILGRNTAAISDILDDYMKSEDRNDSISTSVNYFLSEGYKNNDAKPYEFTIFTKEKKQKILQCLSFPVIYHKETMIISIVRDITEQKLYENELKNLVVALRVSSDLTEAKAHEIERLNSQLTESESQLRATNESKDKFFNIIAHDLKGPLGTFKNVTDLLSKGYDSMNSEEVFDFISNLNLSAKQLFNLLENLLAWARTQTGRIPFLPDYFDMKFVVDSSISLLKPTADKKKISLETRIIDETKVFADINMINTVVRNLISNAIKFTLEGGKISINCTENKNHFEFYVEDNGIGIADDVLDKLFRIDVLFTTVGTSNESGTGLGLILCKEFITKNCGKIRVESKPGKGSRFYFTLPKKDPSN